MTLTAVSQTRYRSDVRRLVVEWLKVYLAGSSYPFAALFKQVGNGVDVYFDDPGLPPVTKLTKPRLVVGDAGEEQFQTILPGTAGNYFGSYRTLTLELRAVTDQWTGGEITCADLAGAVQIIADTYYTDFAGLGATLLECAAGDTVFDADTGLHENITTMKVDVPILGKKVS